jgi:hypothetical protein
LPRRGLLGSLVHTELAPRKWIASEWRSQTVVFGTLVVPAHSAFAFSHLYPTPLHVVVRLITTTSAEARFTLREPGIIHVAGYEFPKRQEAVEKVGVELIATTNRA